MIVIRCDKCGKEFEVCMIRCEPARMCSGSMLFEQEITLLITKDVMFSLKRKGSGEILCDACVDEVDDG